MRTTRSFLVLFFKKGLLTRSLQFRLAGAMLALLVLAVGASSVLDHALQGPMLPAESEATQDGIVLGAFSAVVIVLVWLVSRWSLRPLAEAASEASQVGPARPGARISEEQLPTEIRPLVASVNAALDRMQQAYDAERRFTANAAHELRTPLSVLSLRLQQAQSSGQPDWPGISSDLGHMSALVGALLDLARKEQAGRAEPIASLKLVNLSRVAREAAATALPLAEAAARPLHVDLPDTLALRGRADDLRDMILNLLDNALKHGSGEIRLSARQVEAEYWLEVADDGPGPPPGLQEAVFDRFRKADAASQGSGLGLAIVREVARGHGGEAGFAEAGLVRVRLPAG
jgi:two-component system sensor histidine kinase QseC